jgi:serine/threonine-protein kinase RsbW
VDPRDVVQLTIPAAGAYLTVLRTTTASLAARLDFTLDDIEDLRIAVGEACALVLPEAQPGSDLTCAFFLGSSQLTVRVTVVPAGDVAPDLDSFAWQVLSTLATSADVSTDAAGFSVTITMQPEDVGAGL